MKFYHNYQNDWKGNDCDHVYAVLQKYPMILKKCIRCFRIFEEVKF